VSHPFVSRPALTRYGYLGTDNHDVRLPFDTQTKCPNTPENCESIGHTIAHSEGFHRDICHVKATAAQSTSHNTGVAVKFPVVIEDTMAMLSVDERIYIKQPGVYRVRGRIAYDPASKGSRAVEIIKNSSTNPDAHKLPYATVSGKKRSARSMKSSRLPKQTSVPTPSSLLRQSKHPAVRWTSGQRGGSRWRG
jgi:hypothetical protein